MKSYLIAVAAAIAVIVVAPFETHRTTNPRLDKIDESLAVVNAAIGDLDTKTKASIDRMLESLDSLSGNLADTKVATQVQISDMRDAIDSVKLVATLPPAESQIGDIIPDEQDTAPAPFKTLDVNSSSDIRALADRIAALERQVDELQVLKSQYQAAPKAGGGSTGTLSSSVTYSAPVVYSGGSNGTLSASYYTPAYSAPAYSAPVYSAPSYSNAGQASVRRGLFGRRVYSTSNYGTCSVVNGQVICQ